MVQSDPKVILLQKLLGECPSNPTPLWTSLCRDDSPLISPTWLGDGKGRAAWSLIGKTNSTPLERFLAGTKGETRLASHLSTLSIFPRLEDNWCKGFVLQTEEHFPWAVSTLLWSVFLGMTGRMKSSQIDPLCVCSAASRGSRDQTCWNTFGPRFGEYDLVQCWQICCLQAQMKRVFSGLG